VSRGGGPEPGLTLDRPRQHGCRLHQRRILGGKGDDLHEGEGIRYVARSVETRELFDAGGDGGGLNYTVGSVDFLVARDDAERVRHILDALRARFLSGGAGEDGDSGE